MTLGKRERIVVVAGLALALVIVLYGYVLAPALERSRLQRENASLPWRRN